MDELPGHEIRKPLNLKRLPRVFSIKRWIWGMEDQDGTGKPGHQSLTEILPSQYSEGIWLRSKFPFFRKIGPTG
jgi:hypothetical protein